MRTTRSAGWTVGLVSMAALVLPGRAYGQHTGVEIWANVCGRCHTVQPPERYTPKDWGAIVGHMSLNARLTDAQAAAVLEFIEQGAMRSAAPVPQPRPANAAGEVPEGAGPTPMKGEPTPDESRGLVLQYLRQLGSGVVLPGLPSTR